MFLVVSPIAGLLMALLKSAGGPGAIAEQQVDHHVDVLLGGGRQRFDQPIDAGPDAGRTVVASAQRQGYQVVTHSAGLAAACANPDARAVRRRHHEPGVTGALAKPYPG